MTTTRPARSTLAPLAPLFAVALFVAAACSTGIAPAPSGSPAPVSSAAVPSASAPAGSQPAATPEEAAALVLAADSRFATLGPKNPDLIGGCCFYEVTPTDDGHAVTVEIGWGDCQAGCINRHRWHFLVSRDGTVTLDREEGPAVPAGVPGEGGGAGETGFDTGGGDVAGIRGTALAGPTCPVVTVDDPNCDGRPVVGATIRVVDVTGMVVATLVTDGAGTFKVELPPGPYLVRAEPTADTMSPPAPIEVLVGDGSTEVDLAYDTGIR